MRLKKAKLINLKNSQMIGQFYFDFYDEMSTFMHSINLSLIYEIEDIIYQENPIDLKRLKSYDNIVG